MTPPCNCFDSRREAGLPQESINRSRYDDVAKVLKGAIAPLSFGEKRGLLRFAFAAVAQLVRAPDCGSGGPPFEPGQRYQQNQGLSDFLLLGG